MNPPLLTFSNVGSYTATVTYTLGGASVTSNTVDVLIRPTVTLSVAYTTPGSNKLSFVEGDVATITATGDQAGGTFEWIGTDNPAIHTNVATFTATAAAESHYVGVKYTLNGVTQYAEPVLIKVQKLTVEVKVKPITVRIGAMPTRMPPTRGVAKLKAVNITTVPAVLPAGVTLNLICEADTGTVGSANVSPTSITGSGLVVLSGGTTQSWGAGNNAAPNNIKLKVKLGSIVLDTSAGFTVCAHPNGVECNNPAPINDVNAVGLKVDIVIKSETGTDADLDKVQDSEVVSAALNEVGSFAGVQLGANNSGFMQATTVPPDQHKVNPQGMINIADAGALKNPPVLSGSFDKHQLDAFYCERCGMTEATAEVIPNSGYRIRRLLTHAASPGTKVEFTTIKTATGVTVGRYSSGAGPSPERTSGALTIRP